jgi:ribosomal protein L24
MAAKLKKGDKIVVLSGKDKGKEGEITSVNPSSGKAIVSGVNIAVRHTKQFRLQRLWVSECHRAGLYIDSQH